MNIGIPHNESDMQITRSPAITRKSRPYRLRPKPSIRFPDMEWKQFDRGETVPCMLC